MMSVLALPAGLLLPSLTGWALVRLFEGKKPLLPAMERWILGFVLGTTFTMLVTFLTERAGLIGFTRAGFLSVQILLTVVCAGLVFRMTGKPWKGAETETERLPQWLRNAAIVLACWIALKVIAAGALLLFSPPYFDDVTSNWNLRGKVFFQERQFTLSLPVGNDEYATEGVNSYPPTVPMVKTWLAALRGAWSEPLANAPHLLWYLAGLGLVFCVLRRTAGLPWALLGAYLLASVPLPLIHASAAYGDIFVSLHVFAAVALAYCGLTAEKAQDRAGFLRLSALAAGLLIFTKNEALGLHLPGFIVAMTAVLLLDKKRMPGRELRRALLWFALCAAAVAVPWISYKLMHGLPFGNAKAIGSIGFAWQPGVLRALWLNTFYEGNWILLFPVLLGLVVFRWKTVLRTPLLLPALFCVVVLGAQIFLFCFTGLSTEALRQTGSARGIVQLLPVLVLLGTVLLRDLLEVDAKSN